MLKHTLLSSLISPRTENTFDKVVSKLTRHADCLARDMVVYWSTFSAIIISILGDWSWRYRQFLPPGLPKNSCYIDSFPSQMDSTTTDGFSLSIYTDHRTRQGNFSIPNVGSRSNQHIRGNHESQWNSWFERGLLPSVDINIPFQRIRLRPHRRIWFKTGPRLLRPGNTHPMHLQLHHGKEFVVQHTLVVDYVFLSFQSIYAPEEQPST